MPNHVTTVLVASKEVVNWITRTVTDAEVEEDRKRHEEVNEMWRKRVAEGHELPPWRPKVDMPFEEPDRYRRFVDFERVVPSPPNKETGGCSGTHTDGEVCWYSWNIENWGTKWNGYSTQITPEGGYPEKWRLRFDTAWSHPVPVIERLSRAFPEEMLQVEYADEDLGHNCGAYTMQNGEILNGQEFSGTQEGLDFASQIKYGKSYAELEAEWAEEEEEV